MSSDICVISPVDSYSGVISWYTDYYVSAKRESHPDWRSCITRVSYPKSAREASTNTALKVLAMLLLGAGFGVHGVGIVRRSQALAAEYAVVALLLAIIGCLSLFAGILLHSIRGILTETLRARELLWDEPSESTPVLPR